MFEGITEKFKGLFSRLAKEKKFTEKNISEAAQEVRKALLEADVNYSVATDFVKRVEEKALGEQLIKSVSPTQQFIKIVYDELVVLMGEKEYDFQLKGHLSVIMMCGLQGSGKTTHCVKLANHFKNNKRKILIAACDLQRPAAIDQLKQLASTIEIEVFSIEGEKRPQIVAKKALEKAKTDLYDLLIVDTAGRLHIDDELMDELKEIKDILSPQEVIFVANSTTGQDAVNTASDFNSKIGITGSILTMLDGDARAGAALSIREVTNKPLMFEGIGEKIEDLQVFNPESMADRILGRGDIINLVKKAKQHIDDKESEKLEKKLKKATFNYDDYLKQMKTIKRMGSVKSLLKMVPGFSAISDVNMSDDGLKQMESIILSMTFDERFEQVDITHARRRRISSGSGNKLETVNRLIKSFKRMKQLIKKMPKGGMMPDMQKMKDQMGRMQWP